VTFTRPIIGPKVYVSRGPSGHAETFQRDRADQALRHFLGPITLMIAVDGFIRKKKRERTPDEWGDVLSYLANLLKVPEDHLPLDVCVAFWAQVRLERDARERASLVTEGKGN